MKPEQEPYQKIYLSPGEKYRQYSFIGRTAQISFDGKNYLITGVRGAQIDPGDPDEALKASYFLESEKSKTDVATAIVDLDDGCIVGGNNEKFFQKVLSEGESDALRDKYVEKKPTIVLSEIGIKRLNALKNKAENSGSTCNFSISYRDNTFELSLYLGVKASLIINKVPQIGEDFAKAIIDWNTGEITGGHKTTLVKHILEGCECVLFESCSEVDEVTPENTKQATRSRFGFLRKLFR